MAVVISRSAVIRHVLPTPAEPAAVDQIGQQVADRASQQDGGERVLLNRTAHRLLALADGAARLRIAVQSVAEVTRAPLVGVLGQLGGVGLSGGRNVYRLCGRAWCSGVAILPSAEGRSLVRGERALQDDVSHTLVRKVGGLHFMAEH